MFELQLFDTSELDDAVVATRTTIARSQPKEVISKLRVTNQEENLAKIACPVLAFWGVNDQFCPPSGAMKLAHAIEDIKLVVLSKCGHWVMVEHPEVFDRDVLQFLTD